MRRLIAKDYNPATELTTLYWSHGEGTKKKITVQVVRDSAPNLLQNRQDYNSISSKGKLSQDGLGRKVASIDFGIAEMLLKKKGLNIFTCSNKELFSLLNDPEYKALRTAPGRL